jgi:hypothetical protein
LGWLIAEWSILNPEIDIRFRNGPSGHADILATIAAILAATVLTG